MTRLWMQSVGALLLLAADVLAQPALFGDRSHEQAVEAAAAEGRLVVIDFTAAWCGPCKRMDQTTWVDAAVLHWFEEHAVAVQVDVDEQRDLAMTYSVRAMPTVVVERDGKRLDRASGYQTADELLDWLRGVQAGRTKVDAMREHVTDDEGMPDVNQIFKLAMTLDRSGEADEASAYYLWLWTNALDHQPAWYGVRRSFLSARIKDLAARHDPTRETFLELLERNEQAVRAGRAEPDEWLDWIELAKTLDEVDRVAAWVAESVEAGFTVQQADGKIQRALVDVLLDDGHYEVAARLGADFDERAQRELRMYSMTGQFTMSKERRPAGMTDEQAEQTERMVNKSRADLLRNKLSQFAAAAVLAGDDEAARSIGSRLIETLDDIDSRLELLEIALDQGQARPLHQAWLAEAQALDPDGTQRIRIGSLELRLRAALPTDAGAALTVVTEGEPDLDEPDPDGDGD